MKFLIVAPTYNDINGGAIVLHKLCHLLNSNGFEAAIYPYFGQETYNSDNFLSHTRDIAKTIIKKYWRGFDTNEAFDTPIVYKVSKLCQTIVVYPEIIIGNPLNASNVVRWFLCEPGFHKQNISFSQRDLLVDFNSFLNGYRFPGANIYTDNLYITHMPLEHYNLDGALDVSERQGCAYALRKGRDRPDIKVEDDWILIDGLPHSEVAKIFKKVKVFYSYDMYTAYSQFATMCGADSVVLPRAGVSCQQWFSDESKRYGVAYGKDDIHFARKTRDQMYFTVLNREKDSQNKVLKFADYAREFFKQH